MTDTALDLIELNVEALAGWLDGINELVAQMNDVTTLTVRSLLDELSSQVRGAIGATDLRLIELLEPGQVLGLSGVGQVVVETKGRQTTNGAKLARTLAVRVADTAFDPETGEKIPPAVLTERTADELVDVFGLDVPSASFRSTAVKSRGLRVSEFRAYEDGKAKVRFER